MEKAKNMDRKAWLKIVEAFLAILLIIGFLMVIVEGIAPKKDISNQVYEKESHILDVISKNNTLREKVMSSDFGEDNREINETIRNLIPGNWEFKTKICTLEDICNALVPTDRDVYTSEIVITSDLSVYNPKKLKMFAWVK